jgi:hypothetical protein
MVTMADDKAPLHLFMKCRCVVRTQGLVSHAGPPCVGSWRVMGRSARGLRSCTNGVVALAGGPVAPMDGFVRSAAHVMAHLMTSC